MRSGGYPSFLAVSRVLTCTALKSEDSNESEWDVATHSTRAGCARRACDRPSGCGELTYEQAYAILNDEEDLERPAAEDIIERLYMKGHLYEVEGKLRLTDY